MLAGHGLSLGSDGVGGVEGVTFENVFVNGDGPQGTCISALLVSSLPCAAGFGRESPFFFLSFSLCI